MDRLFDRFWQASRHDRTGSGLGLAIVRGHRGGARRHRCEVTRSRDEGAAFHIVLPASLGSTSHRWEDGGDPVKGGMMDVPLTRAAPAGAGRHTLRRQAGGEPRARRPDVPGLADVRRRAAALAAALAGLGVRPGDRVATLAWNTHRHLELYFGGAGSPGPCCSPVNARLSAGQIAQILRHAGARVIFADAALAVWRTRCLRACRSSPTVCPSPPRRRSRVGGPTRSSWRRRRGKRP